LKGRIERREGRIERKEEGKMGKFVLLREENQRIHRKEPTNSMLYSCIESEPYR
jgi:hypothetical protein